MFACFNTQHSRIGTHPGRVSGRIPHTHCRAVAPYWHYTFKTRTQGETEADNLVKCYVQAPTDWRGLNTVHHHDRGAESNRSRSRLLLTNRLILLSSERAVRFRTAFHRCKKGSLADYPQRCAIKQQLPVVYSVIPKHQAGAADSNAIIIMSRNCIVGIFEPELVRCSCN
jgi:hypothetical protein